MPDPVNASPSIRVVAVVPCYRERSHILDVLARFDDTVSGIIVVDDACPESTGSYVTENCHDPRVEVIRHDRNQGVGGATMTGYRRALERGADIIVKVDGDGQMDPEFIPTLTRPIVEGRADYTKGNRFYLMEGVAGMPFIRLLGNLILSFASKASSGYWKIFDPTNGFTAIHGRVAALLTQRQIDLGYFFESDMLFHLYLSRAVVADVPMKASYGAERSTLSIPKIVGPFLWKHLRNLGRRIIYSYFIRDFSIASMELVVGLFSFVFGVIYGSIHWYESIETGIAAPTGVVILAAVTFLLGVYLLIGFLNFDIQNQPETPLHDDL
jgi:glycosyltransferase involved in cell wall biosynthesis